MAVQVTSRYQVTTRSARGLNSIDSFHDIAEAFWESGKAKLVLIVLSDYDPEGELIPHDAGRRLRDDFGLSDGLVEVYKAGVTGSRSPGTTCRPRTSPRSRPATSTGSSAGTPATGASTSWRHSTRG